MTKLNFFFKNFDFSPKFWLCNKNLIFHQNFIFSSKFHSWTKIFIFHKNCDFCREFLFFTKIVIFVEIFYFSPKLFIFNQNFYFWRWNFLTLSPGSNTLKQQRFMHADSGERIQIDLTTGNMDPVSGRVLKLRIPEISEN